MLGKSLLLWAVTGLTACAADPMQSLFEEARAGNPALATARASTRVATHLSEAAGVLPDPLVSAGVHLVPVETRVGPQEWKASVSQSFPWPGTLTLQRAASESDAATERWNEAVVWQDVVYQLYEAVIELQYLDQAMTITEANRLLLRRLEDVAQSRFRTGASLAGVTQIQIEQGRTDEQLAALDDRRRPWLSKLSALVGRSSTELPPAYPDELTWPPPPPMGELVERMGQVHPGLLRLEQAIVANRTRASLAQIHRYPRWTVGMEYIATGDADQPGVKDSGQDPVIAMAGLRLPFQRSRIRAEIAAAEAKVNRSRAALEQARQSLTVQLETALASWQEADRKATLYAGRLIPLANQSLQVAEPAYRNGSETFQTLIDVERTLLDLQLTLARAQADRSLATAKIHTLVPDYPGVSP